MSYALRNSIILFLLLIIIVVVNIINNHSSLDKLNKLERQKDEKIKLLNKLDKLNPDLQRKEEIISEHKKYQEIVSENPKILLNDDTPTLTYDYLTNLSDNHAPGFVFDFIFRESGKVNDTYYNKYKLTGNASVNSIYNFIRQLEKQPPLYKIDDFILHLSGANNIYSDTLNFTMNLVAYYDINGVRREDIDFRDLSFKNLVQNPFKMQLYDPSKRKYPSDQLNVNKLQLIGLTNEKIFLKTDYGSIKTLSEGDKVAFGYLENIDWEEQKAIFKINDIGIYRKKILKLED